MDDGRPSPFRAASTRAGTVPAPCAHMMVARRPRPLSSRGRHVVSGPVATGGMASIHLAVSSDAPGRVLALKRLLPHLANDPRFTRMLLAEAAIGARVRHENVVTTHGADILGHDTVLVMDYVPGLSLRAILRRSPQGAIPARFAAAILADTLRGLHAAHEAVDTSGAWLAIVHRDVCPQNILIGLDGVARVLDFGIAEAKHTSLDARSGDLDGKLAYMAPERLCGDAIDRRADIYSAAVVLWEALVGAPLFAARNDVATYAKALEGCSTRPGERAPGVADALDAVVMRGLAMHPGDRFATALDMARAIDAVQAFDPARRDELRAWLRDLGAATLRGHARAVAGLRRRALPSTPVTPSVSLARSLSPPGGPMNTDPEPFARRLATASLVPALIALGGACAAPTDGEVSSTESGLSGYSTARGERLANRALSLWNGKPSRDLCLAGVGDTLETSGVVSPAFPRLPSAVAFDDWARANPGELARRGFEKQSPDINHIPRGSIITWRPGQCGYHARYGHVEIVVDGASTRACSDYCGSIRKTCGAPGVYVPVGGRAPGGASGGGACEVRADARLHCANRRGAPLRAEPRAQSPVVNILRTTNSWFDCWTSGDRHAGGNTTWYHTVGDDNANQGFVGGVDLETPDAFDANPSAAGLAKCRR